MHGGLSGILRPLADASESANQCDLETKHAMALQMLCQILDPCVGISMAIEALVHTMQPVMVHHSVDMSIRSLFV